jgi:hypothetical protein
MNKFKEVWGKMNKANVNEKDITTFIHQLVPKFDFKYSPTIVSAVVSKFNIPSSQAEKLLNDYLEDYKMTKSRMVKTKDLRPSMKVLVYDNVYSVSSVRIEDGVVYVNFLGMGYDVEFKPNDSVEVK